MPILWKSLRDPHCGNLVGAGRGITIRVRDRELHFCSEACLRHFRAERFR